MTDIAHGHINVGPVGQQNARMDTIAECMEAQARIDQAVSLVQAVARRELRTIRMAAARLQEENDQITHRKRLA